MASCTVMSYDTMYEYMYFIPFQFGVLPPYGTVQIHRAHGLCSVFNSNRAIHARSYSWNPTKIFPLFVFILRCTHAGGIDLFFTEHAVRAITFRILFFFNVDRTSTLRRRFALLAVVCYVITVDVAALTDRFSAVFRPAPPVSFFDRKRHRMEVSRKTWYCRLIACCPTLVSPVKIACIDCDIVFANRFSPWPGGPTYMQIRYIVYTHTVRVRACPFDVRACLKCKHGTRDLKRKWAHVCVCV